MMNRISNRLIARFVAVAALLALVMAAPAVFAQDSEVDYAENGTESVASFSATDQDGDAIEWSLSGPDAAKFEISDDGALSFKSSPNFESAGDADGDNVYMVTVSAARGSTDVAVTVTNVDEPGSVSLNDLQPQAGAGQSVSASVSDPDGSPVTTTWQWSRSMDAASWEDISGATAATYTPQEEEDDGYYLRATATYSDGLGSGRDSASGESAFPVEIRPTANFAPSFEVQDETGPAVDDEPDTADSIQDNIVITRTVSETAKIGASIGNAVVATDSDNDPLLYTLADFVAETNDDGNDDSQWFKIDRKTGQISAASPSNQAALTTVLNQEPPTDTDARTSFVVTVTATDPSGADATETVTINVDGVDEAPVITRLVDLATATNIVTAGPNNFLVSTEEQDQLDPDEATGGDAEASVGLPHFDANDPENTTADDEDIEWSVSGADAGRFQIVELDVTDEAQAALRFTKPYPSFEAMDSADGTNVYVVVVSAYDGEARSSKTVTVTVDNIEEPGTVNLSQRRPQEGIPITASLSDPDGNITGTSWQWYRGTGSLVDDGDNLLTDLVKCSADAADPATTPCEIDDGTSATYVPTSADADNTLQVWASYKDGFVTLDADDADVGDTATEASEHVSVARPNANAAPRFLDKGPLERSVAENIKGASVGDPVAAIDADPMIYTLSGDDAAAFKIDTSGQLTTAEKLDYETKSSYSVTVTATDPSLASGSVMVNISVTDADDPAVITGNSVEYAENGTDPVGSFAATDQDGDDIEWSLNGPDASKFSISANGALSFKKSPNYESAGDADGDNIYMVTVRAARGSTDVAVTVTNVDEAGSVSLSDLQPQAGAGQSVTATVSDTDGSPISTAWQWSRSMDMAEWSDIDGATAATYTPQEEDDGYYLRATATYSDGLGSERDSASGESAFAVEIRPNSNFAPSFEVQDETGPTVDDQNEADDPAGIQDDIVVTRTVSETAKAGASIGNAVVATDADNDPLLYTLAGGAITYTASPTGDDAPTPPADSSALFTIDKKTGQISVKGSANLAFLNREAYATTGADAGADDSALAYMVTVTATDPSGADTMVTVTINVAAVDEAPVITRDDDLTAEAAIQAAGPDRFLVNTDEQDQLDPDDPTGTAAQASIGLPVFEADDPEGSNGDVIWSVSGADAGRFQIVNIRAEGAADTDPARAALRFTTPYPSFEAMDSADGDNVYEVVVTAYDGSARSSKTVSVTVDNIEESGSVSLSQRRPQEGIPVTARLTDPDGNITGTKWQWYRGGTPTDGVITISADVDDCAADNIASSDPEGTPLVCRIPDGTSATYVPTGPDATNYLSVTASYLDGFATDDDTLNTDGTVTAGTSDGADDGDTASKASEHVSVARPNANARPRFLDKGPLEREVAENVKGASVGDPVAGIDADPLIYTLSGDDKDAFKIDTSGQITTAMKLDYETKSSYTVTVTATDPSLASASIAVNITVTDADDSATVTLLTGNAPAFAAEEMTRSVAENTAAGTAIGDPVAATDEDGDALTYTLWGDDAGSFGIDSATGQLMTSAALDYETKMSYTVTVTASSGKADEMDAMTTVTISVTDEGLDNAYDLNEDGAIERDEVIAAIQDYLAGNIERSEVTALIRLYFGNGG